MASSFRQRLGKGELSQEVRGPLPQIAATQALSMFSHTDVTPPHHTKHHTPLTVSSGNARSDEIRNNRKIKPLLLRRRKRSVRHFVCLASLLMIVSILHYYVKFYKYWGTRGASFFDQLQKIANVTTVSIGTVPSRRTELLKTLDSIFRQTFPPSRVQVHYSSTKYTGHPTFSPFVQATKDDESYPDLHTIIQEAMELLASAQGQKNGLTRTELSFHPADPNWKSVTKLFGFLHQKWNGTTPQAAVVPIASNLRRSSTLNTDNNNEEEILVVVADDDFEYLPTWLESLLAGHLLYPNCAVALRGWRVRKDLRYGAPPIVQQNSSVAPPAGIWGSFPAAERYVIRGANIREPFRFGVVTGVNGILFRPSFFDGSIFDAPSADFLAVDDIWYSGNLANRSIERWVVPFRGASNGDRDVGAHLGQSNTVIDGKLKASTRARANRIVIEHFAESWKKGDGAHLWWSEDVTPKLRGLLPFRHWFSEHIILRLYSMSWVRSIFGTGKV